MIRNNGEVGVVILNYNKKQDLVKAVECALASSCADRMHLVIVDNASSDGSADAVAESFPGVPLVRNSENLGVSGGRNSGWRYLVEHADFQYIVFLDDDTEIDPHYLERVVDAMERDPGVGVVAGKAWVNRETRDLMSVGINVNLFTGSIYDLGVGEKDAGQYDQPRMLDACGGFAFATRAELFAELGFFDERYNPYGWEDVDYCLKARKRGFQVAYVPTAVLVHKGSKAGRRPKPEYEKHKVKNYLVLLRRHTSLTQKLSCGVFVPLKCLAVAIEMVRSGNGRVIGSQVAGFLRGLSHREAS